MNILALETSTKNFSMALAQNGKVRRSRNVILDKILSSSIIPAIEKILREAGMNAKMLDGIAVGLGPGSFTSLRVGLATVKGLAFGLNTPVVGFSSLDILAGNALRKKAPRTEWVCVMNDARRGFVYSAVYRRKDQGLERQDDPSLSSPDEVLRHLQGEVLFIGDAVAVYQDHIRSAGLKGKKYRPVLAEKTLWFPQAKELLALALPRFERGQADDPDRLSPVYLYPENCQVDQIRAAKK